MKYAGIYCMIVSSTFIGCSASATLSQRIKRIRLIRKLVDAIITELRSKLPYIPNLLRSLAEQQAFTELRFLKNASAYADSFPESWIQAIHDDCLLQTDEKHVLDTIGRTLGSTTLEGQLSALNLCQEELKAMEEDAELLFKQRGSLYRSIGLLCGCFAAILLL